MNRRSHRADQLEYDAMRMFERYADRGALLELYDRAVEEQEGRDESRPSLQRRAALADKLADLDLERRGHLRQNARGVLSDGELDDLLGEIDTQREQIGAELHATDDAAAAAQRIRAARASLLSAKWYEDPDAIQPHEWPSVGASPGELRRAYNRFGARFEVGTDGDLTLRLTLTLDGGPLQLARTSS